MNHETNRCMYEGNRIEVADKYSHLKRHLGKKKTSSTFDAGKMKYLCIEV